MAYGNDKREGEYTVLTLIQCRPSNNKRKDSPQYCGSHTADFDITQLNVI